MRIFLVEVMFTKEDGTERWIPMYQPCYSRVEAEKKMKGKHRWSTHPMRVTAYVRQEGL
jgi:hypothetical protein